MTVVAGGAFAEVRTERLLSGEEWVQLLTATAGPASEYIQPGQSDLTTRQ
jgi:hypothetical protein